MEDFRKFKEEKTNDIWINVADKRKSPDENSVEIT